MGSNDIFEAVPHPLRIEINKALAEKPTRFANIKRKFKIDSSGLLDFHLKKLNNLITVNYEGCYALTEKGFAALNAVETVSRYGWQKRSFYLNLVVCVLLNAYTVIESAVWLPIVLSITFAWMAFYGHWTFVRRRVRFLK